MNVLWMSCDREMSIMWPSCDSNVTASHVTLYLRTYIPILYTALQHQRLVLGIVQQLPHILRSAFSSCPVYHHLEARVPLSRGTQEAATSYLLQEYSTVSVYTQPYITTSIRTHPMWLYNKALYCVNVVWYKIILSLLLQKVRQKVTSLSIWKHTVCTLQESLGMAISQKLSFSSILSYNVLLYFHDNSSYMSLSSMAQPQTPTWTFHSKISSPLYYPIHLLHSPLPSPHTRVVLLHLVALHNKALHIVKEGMSCTDNNLAVKLS